MTTNNSTDKLLIDFNENNQQNDWKIINDGVMGGCSKGNFQIMATGMGCFHGNLSLKNNGGFVTARVPLNHSISKEYNGILIRVLGDGNLYSFRIKTSHRSNDIQYKHEFETKLETWQNVKLPFKDFKAVYRGKTLNEAPALLQSEIKEMGFLIAHKQAGDFCLFISSIALYK